MRRLNGRFTVSLVLLGMIPVAAGCESCDPTWSAIAGGVIAGGGAALLGADTGEAIAIGAAGAAVGYLICKASQEEKQKAELEAAKAKARMQEEEIARLRQENRKLAVPVNDKNDYVLIDPDTGKPVNDKKYRLDAVPTAAPTAAESGSTGGSATEGAQGGDSGAVAASGDSTQAATGEIDGFNVVFVPRS